MRFKKTRVMSCPKQLGNVSLPWVCPRAGIAHSRAAWRVRTGMAVVCGIVGWLGQNCDSSAELERIFDFKAPFESWK